jgi:glycosyltransferase involved in cell wall biosynthesis
MIKIIYILSSIPPYETFGSKPKTPVHFMSSNGNWIGIWQNEWGNVLGNQILRYSNKINFEFWRPDHKADQIYSYCFNNGLVHKVFPAQLVYKRIGLKKNQAIESIPLIKELKKIDKNYDGNIILHIGIKGNLVKHICKEINNIPIIGSFHGEIKLPHNDFLKFRKNLLTYLYLIKDYYSIKKMYKRFNLVTYQTQTNVRSLQRIYKGPLAKVTMGVDFNEFQNKNKYAARKALNLPVNRTILITVSRFNDNKQIDKFIDVLKSFEGNYDFLYIAIGNGASEYENYLNKKANSLIKQKKISFPGYVGGQKLVNYLNAADLFVMPSKHEAGPVSSMEALACETPVFSTNTGRVAEILNKYNKGKVVGSRNYKEWKYHLKNYLEGKKIEILDREVAKKYFSWASIAKQFIQLYKNIKRNE